MRRSCNFAEKVGRRADYLTRWSSLWSPRSIDQPPKSSGTAFRKHHGGVPVHAGFAIPLESLRGHQRRAAERGARGPGRGPGPGFCCFHRRSGRMLPLGVDPQVCSIGHLVGAKSIESLHLSERHPDVGLSAARFSRTFRSQLSPTPCRTPGRLGGRPGPGAGHRKDPAPRRG